MGVSGRIWGCGGVIWCCRWGDLGCQGHLGVLGGLGVSVGVIWGCLG